MALKQHLLFLLIIVSATIAVYSSTFSGQFVYDDIDYIVKNHAIRSLDSRSAASFFFDNRTTSADEGLSRDVWRPLVTLSFAIDYRLWALNPRLFHIENSILHAIAAILVYMTIFAILKDGFGAFIAAILFAIHPVQVEAVAPCSGRTNVLFAVFFLASFLCHIKNTGLRLIPYLLSLALYLAGLLSKEMAVTLPVLMLAYDLYFRKKEKAGYYALYYLPYAVLASFYIFMRSLVIGVMAQKTEWWGGGVISNVLVMIKAIKEYIVLSVAPSDMNAYRFPEIPSSVIDPAVISSGILFLTVLLAFIYLRRNKAASFFVLWFFIALLPVSNIIPIKAIMAERFLYLSIAGYGALFGMAFSKTVRLQDVNRRIRLVITGIFASALVYYGILSISRNVEWSNELFFYMADAKRAPGHPKPHYNLAYAYTREAVKRSASSRGEALGYFLLAEREYGLSLSIKPLSAVNYSGLGYLYMEFGQYEKAVKNLKKSLVLKEDANAYNNLAVCYNRIGRYADAADTSRKAIRIHPGHAKAWVNLGNAYFALKENQKARMAWVHASDLGYRDAKLSRIIEDLEREDL